MRFLRPDQLEGKIMADGLGEKSALGGPLDRDYPGRNGNDHKDHPGKRIQTAQPAQIPVGDRQRRDRRYG